MGEIVSFQEYRDALERIRARDVAECLSRFRVNYRYQFLDAVPSVYGVGGSIYSSIVALEPGSQPRDLDAGPERYLLAKKPLSFVHDFPAVKYTQGYAS